MRHHSTHLRLLATVLLLSYGLCHLGEGALRVAHTVSHELDTVWDHFAGNLTHGHAHGHGHSHASAEPHQHNFSALRQRANLASRRQQEQQHGHVHSHGASHSHAHPLLSALAAAQEQPESSTSPNGEKQLKHPAAKKKVIDQHPTLQEVNWADLGPLSRAKFRPLDEQPPTGPSLRTVVPPPQV